MRKKGKPIEYVKYILNVKMSILVILIVSIELSILIKVRVMQETINLHLSQFTKMPSVPRASLRYFSEYDLTLCIYSIRNLELYSLLHYTVLSLSLCYYYLPSCLPTPFSLFSPLRKAMLGRTSKDYLSQKFSERYSLIKD